MVERRSTGKSVDAHKWLEQKFKEADQALTPGDPDRTRVLLEKLKNHPNLLQGQRGRPPKQK